MHQHLSPLARAVAGPWVRVLAGAKLAMAGVMAVTCVCYAQLASGGSISQDELCSVGHLFCWVTAASCLSQTCAAVAFLQIERRARSLVGDEDVFSKVTGEWWTALAVGTLAVGVALFSSGCFFVFIPASGFTFMAVMYLLAALAQGLAGIAMLVINCRVRTYFRTADGESVWARAVHVTLGRTTELASQPV